MSDLAGAKSFIEITDVDYKSAISEALIQKIAASVNWLQENMNNQYGLGDYVWSALDTAAFQAIYGTNFVKGYSNHWKERDGFIDVATATCNWKQRKKQIFYLI